MVDSLLCHAAGSPASFVLPFLVTAWYLQDPCFLCWAGTCPGLIGLVTQFTGWFAVASIMTSLLKGDLHYTANPTVG